MVYPAGALNHRPGEYAFTFGQCVEYEVGWLLQLQGLQSGWYCRGQGEDMTSGMLRAGWVVLLVAWSLVTVAKLQNPDGGDGGAWSNAGSGELTPSPTVTQPSVTEVPRQLLPDPPQSITCPMRNKCSRREYITMTYHDSNCFCDDLCPVFRDCCKDYKRPGRGLWHLQKSTISCHRVMEINPEVELYIVDSCPRDFNGDPEIQDKCEMDTSLAWGNGQAFFRLPVAGKKSKIMYKNYYCALCSGDVDVTFWNVKLGCGEIPLANMSADPKEIVDNVLMFTKQNKYYCGLEFSDPGIKPRVCKSHIARCDKSWKDQRIKKKCKSHTAYVYVGKEVFKNKYCAVCNYVNESYLSCEDTRTPQPGGELGSGGIGDITAPFSILLDLNTGKGSIKEHRVGVGVEKEVTVTVVQIKECAHGHVYDPFAKICRELRCQAGYIMSDGGGCVSGTRGPSTPSTTIAATISSPSVEADNLPTQPHTTTPTPAWEYYDTQRPNQDNTNILDGLFPKGEHERDNTYREENIEEDYYDQYEYDGKNAVLIPGDATCPTISLTEEEYRMFDNLSIVVYSSGRVYNSLEYDEIGGIVFVCSPFDNSTYTEEVNITKTIIMFKFDRLQGLVSFVGVLVSAVALLMMLVVYLMLPPLRNIPGMCVMSLALALLFAQMLFLVGVPRTEVHYVCLGLAAALHYTFLAAFFWMNVMAYDIWRSFSSKAVKHSHSSCRFCCYSLYAWFIPALIVGGSVGMDFLEEYIDDIYRPHYGEGICWIVRRYALLFLFALPLALILVINIIFYIATIRSIYLISQTSKSLHQQSKIKDKGKLVLYIKLSFIMGLTWIFGFIAALTDMHVMWYVFISFNTLQGVFICFAFVCNKKVFRLLRDKGRVHRMHPYGDANRHGNNHSRTYMTRHTYLSDGEAKIISQETSI